MDDFASDEDSNRTRTFFSRVLVIVLFLWIAGFGIVSFYRSLQPNENRKTLVSPYKAWDGEWTGEIIVTDENGSVVRQVSQRRRYRHVLSEDDFRQEGHFYETTPEGEEELESQMNSMDFKFKALRRKTIRKNGAQSVDYIGKVEDGKVIWSHSGPVASFTLQEWVEGDELHLDGVEKVKTAGIEQQFKIHGLFRRKAVEGAKPMDAADGIADNNGVKSNDAQTTMSEVPK